MDSVEGIDIKALEEERDDLKKRLRSLTNAVISKGFIIGYGDKVGYKLYPPPASWEGKIDGNR